MDDDDDENGHAKELMERRESVSVAQHTNRISNATQNPPIVEYIPRREVTSIAKTDMPQGSIAGNGNGSVCVFARANKISDRSPTALMHRQ